MAIIRSEAGSAKSEAPAPDALAAAGAFRLPLSVRGGPPC